MNKYSDWAAPAPLDVDALLLRLGRQQTLLSRYIDRRWSDLDAVQLARLLSTHGENAACLGRLLRDWRAIHGDPPDILERAIDEALHELGTEWGVQLIDPALLEGQDPIEPPLDIDHLIADLDDKCTRLDQHLSRCSQHEDDKNLARLFAVYSRNMARLGRLCRLRHQLYPGIPDDLAKLMEETLLEMDSLQDVEAQ
jgi:hypothetical protein